MPDDAHGTPRRNARTNPSGPARVVRRAEVADAPEVARLLHDFNTEFAEPTPGVAALTRRARELLAAEGLVALLGGEGPDGLAIVRFRASLWADALDAYLEELYVAPAQRGRGLGRVLLEAAIKAAREAGAVRMEIATSEADTTAIALYASCGFTNLEDGPDGPRMLFYEREL